MMMVNGIQALRVTAILRPLRILAAFILPVITLACSSPITTETTTAAAPPASQKQSAPTAGDKIYDAPARLAILEDKAIDESSGLVASRQNPGLLWTHNDSDKQATLYLIDRAGKSRGRWRIAGIKPYDWEDIAAARDPATNLPHLYIGDIGDNSAKRREILVHRIVEPSLSSLALEPKPSDSRPQFTEPAETFRFRYPDGARDAETLLVHPTSGDIYIVTKRALAPAEVYRARAPFDTARMTTLELVATINIPSLVNGVVTGGDISPDGLRVVLCDYIAAYEFTLRSSKDKFDAIWQTAPAIIALDARTQGEAICYRLDGQALLTTSEGLPTPLGEVVRTRKP
jgi:hypothetical protein